MDAFLGNLGQVESSGTFSVNVEGQLSGGRARLPPGHFLLALVAALHRLECPVHKIEIGLRSLSLNFRTRWSPTAEELAFLFTERPSLGAALQAAREDGWGDISLTFPRSRARLDRTHMWVDGHEEYRHPMLELCHWNWPDRSEMENLQRLLKERVAQESPFRPQGCRLQAYHAKVEDPELRAKFYWGDLTRPARVCWLHQGLTIAAQGFHKYFGLTAELEAADLRWDLSFQDLARNRAYYRAHKLASEAVEAMVDRLPPAVRQMVRRNPG